jgi:hypothetical protein
MEYKRSTSRAQRSTSEIQVDYTPLVLRCTSPYSACTPLVLHWYSACTPLILHCTSLVLHCTPLVLRCTPLVLHRYSGVLESRLFPLDLCSHLLVDIFYMKTCSFRGAEPRLNNIEGGLFCGNDEPQGRYTMLPCCNLFCPSCHPSNQWMKSKPWPVVEFTSSSMHRFVNGYTTYLNCPAVCFSIKIFIDTHG